ncbi:MAG: Ig-like domain-containing protein [Gemmatimonadota bacterium]
MSSALTFSRLGRFATLFAFLGIAACGSDETGPLLESVSELRIDVSTTTVAAGTSIPIVANAIYSSGRVEEMAAQWSSTDALCATVVDGQLVALHSGTVTLTAQAGSRAATKQIVITPYGREIGPAGGELQSLDDRADIQVPSGALNQTVFVSAEWSFPTEYQSQGVVAGSAYTIRFGDAVLQNPVRVRLRYEPSNLGPDAKPVFLRLHRWTGQAWAPIPGGMADTNGHFAEGMVSESGVYGVMEIVPPVDHIVVEISEGLLHVGDATQLTVTLYNVLGEVLEGREIHFSSSDARIATVQSDGFVEAKGPGVAHLSVASEGVSVEVSLEVVTAVLYVSLTPASLELLPGQSIQLSAAVRDGAGKLTAPPLTWFTMDDKVAKVSESGRVTALAPGETRIGVVANGVRGWASVRVIKPAISVASVEITSASLTVEKGDVIHLTAILRDQAGNVLHDRLVVWSTSHHDIGEPLSTEGYEVDFKAWNVGTFVATATSEGVSGSLEITVIPATVPTIVVDPAVWTGHPGEEVVLVAEVHDGNGNPVPGQQFTFTSSDPSVASVDGTGTVRAHKAGSAVITVTNGTLSTTVKITVATPGGGGGEPPEEGYGNNLSWPVVFSEGYGITGLPVSQDPGVRPTPAEGITVGPLPFFAPGNVSDYNQGGVPFYQQQTSNTWRASWLDGSTSAQAVEAKWGDNLTHQTWNANSVVRIEHTLTSLTVPELPGYTMAYLYGSGPDEMQGTDANVGSFIPTVYSVMPRLIIERLDDVTHTPVAEVFNGSIADGLGQDGPGFYSAEVNVAGKIVYGYNFFLRNVNLPGNLAKDGWWRITFVLDSQANLGTGYMVTGNTAITSVVDEGNTALLYPPAFDAQGNKTWLDVYVSASSGGGGGGGGQHGPPAKVNVTPASGSVHVGESLALTVEVLDPNGIPLTEPVYWSSSDPGIAEVDNSGNVTGKATGSVVITAMSGGIKGTASISVTQPGGGGPGGPGGEPPEEGYGNNLSWPVIFAEGLGITGLPVGSDPGVRPTAAEGITVPSNAAFFWSGNVPDFEVGGVQYYQQKSANTWRAQWADGSAAGLQSAEVDWGDNLTHHTWNTHSIIRIEHTLVAWQSAAAAGFNMAYLSGTGPSELQGTDGSMGSFVPTIYSVAPRLKIEKLDNTTLQPLFTAYEGTIADGLGQDGPGYYNAEVNVAGKIIYGYNFFLRDVTLPPNEHRYGWWRITFSIDDFAMVGGASVAHNVSLDACGEAQDPTLIYVPVLDPNGRFTYLDIWVDQAGGGGGGGSGGGGGGGGGGGSGGGSCGGGGQH